MGTMIRRGVTTKIFTPVVTAAAYAANNCVGTLFEMAGAMLDNGGYAAVKSCVGLSKAKSDPALNLILFSQKPSTTFTDKTAFDPSAADIALITGVVSFGTTWKDFATGSATETSDLDAVVHAISGDALNAGPTKGTSLWGVLTIASGTPTFGSTSDLTVKISLEQY